MKREKRLKKGIESIEKQRNFHEEKKRKAEEEGKFELANYYSKEIESMDKRIEDRKEKINRK